MKTVLITIILLQNLIFHSSFSELGNNSIHIKRFNGFTDSTGVIYKSDKLLVKQLSPNVYQHITFLNSESFGKVSCNGMIVLDKNEALVFDTPSTNEDSEELLTFLTRKLKLKVKGVVATHFHIDCLGGLETFHKYGITSYASKKTIASAKTQNYPLPQKPFDEKLVLAAGNKKAYIEYFGEGHTRDNVIAWFPDDKIIFGGCLIKEQGATKGNLADANTTAWPETVKKIKLKYPDVRIIIPGHGETGGINLLEYTIGLFEAR
jgi:metallo-beta-lactamase class B